MLPQSHFEFFDKRKSLFQNIFRITPFGSRFWSILTS